jgi:HEAT repeat protein
VVLSVEDVCNPQKVSLEDAIRAARERAEERRTYEIEVFRYLSQHLLHTRVDVDIVERALEVLMAIAPVARLHGALRSAFAHDDARVRSKAAIAVARCITDLPLLQRLLGDTDARVRANTIEALWYMREPEIEAIFFRSLADPYHRTVANAAFGLYLIDPEKYFPRVTMLVEHPHAGYRTAGAWLLGKIGDSAHIPLLRPLLLEKNTDVRGAAFRALAALRATDQKPTEQKSTEQKQPEPAESIVA